MFALFKKFQGTNRSNGEIRVKKTSRNHSCFSKGVSNVKKKKNVPHHPAVKLTQREDEHEVSLSTHVKWQRQQEVVPSDFLLESSRLRRVELDSQTHGERRLSWRKKNTKCLRDGHEHFYKNWSNNQQDVRAATSPLMFLPLHVFVEFLQIDYGL